MSTFARSRAWTLTGLCALLASQPCAGQAIPTPEAPRSAPAPAPMVLAQSINIPIFEFRLPRPAPPETHTAPARQAQPIARPTTFKVPKTGAERRALFEQLPGSAELRQYFITDTDTFIDTLALLATSEKTPPLLDKAFADFHVAEAVSAYVGYFNGVDPRKAPADSMPANTLAAFELVTIYVVYAGPDGYAKVKPLLTPPTSKNVLSATAIMCPVLLNSHSIPECSTRAADYDAPAKDTMVAGDTRPKFDLPPLMQGGADTLFDVLGVSPGMDCDVAKARIQAAYGRVQGFPLYEARRSRYTKVEGARTEFEYRVIGQRMIDATKDEEIRIECSLKDDLGQVYQIYRRWAPQPSVPNKPTVEQLKAQLEAKYGPFRSDFTRPDGSVAVFANLYNSAGRMSGPDEACGRFLHGVLGAMATVVEDPDPARCSFGIYVIMEPYMSDRSRVGKLELTIWDYARFGKLALYNMLRKQEMQKTVPVQGPRL